MRTCLIVVIAGLAVAAAILGYRVLAGNDDERADPQRPETATPSPEEEEGYWTPERLKEARPIEMPYAPDSLTSTEEPDPAQPGPSQSGAGSAGGDVATPEERTTLIPGVSNSDSGDKSKE